MEALAHLVDPLGLVAVDSGAVGQAGGALDLGDVPEAHGSQVDRVVFLQEGVECSGMAVSTSPSTPLKNAL